MLQARRVQSCITFYDEEAATYEKNFSSSLFAFSQQISLEFCLHRLDRCCRYSGRHNIFQWLIEEPKNLGEESEVRQRKNREG